MFWLMSLQIVPKLLLDSASGRKSNSRPLDSESDALTTMSHQTTKNYRRTVGMCPPITEAVFCAWSRAGCYG